MRSSKLVILLKYIVLITVCVTLMGPVVVAILGSMRTTGDFTNRPFGLPTDGIYWENYTRVLENEFFWQSFKNSLLITLGVTVLVTIFSSFLAFVFSRMTFLGRGLLFNILSFGLLFPLVVAILPIFIQVRSMGLIDSLWGVILPLVAFGIPGSVVILRGFFVAIPSELEDAAYIDGCTTIGFFRYILFPMARPAITAVATIQVIAAWNEYFLPLVVLSRDENWPLPLGIMQFRGQYGADTAGIMAYVTILIIPAVVFYLFMERHIVTGLTGGELKG
ncbi:MAG: carbohydrate ABC transporter permease [Anaerolineae bacterium]|nr:carbohydrate ABC transporter permease [Anaerolineae bacterium]